MWESLRLDTGRSDDQTAYERLEPFIIIFLSANRSHSFKEK